MKKREPPKKKAATAPRTKTGPKKASAHRVARRPTARDAQWSQRHWQELVETSAAWIWETDASLHHTYTNAFVMKCLGYLPAEFLERDTIELIHPDDRTKVDELVRKAATSGEGWTNIVLRWRHKDGSWRSIESSGVAIYDQENNFIGLRGVDRDITDRIRAETKLRESENRFRKLFENLSVVALVLDPMDGRILDANEAAAAYYGWPRERLRSMNIGQINSLSTEEIRARMATVERSKQAFFLFRHRRADGSVRDVEVYSGPIPFEGRTVLYSIVHDVTERKQAEESLKQSEDRFRKAFHTSPDSININRLDDGMYVSINRGFSQITGYSEQEVIGKTSQELNVWVDQNDRKRLVEGLRTKGEVQNLEARFRTKPGAIKYGLMSASVIEIDGVPHVLSVTRDITDRKRAERDLRDSEARLRDAIEFLPTPIGIADRTGTILYYNAAFVDHYGYRKEDTPTIGDWAVHAYPDPAYRERAIRQWSEDVAAAARNGVSTPAREYRITCKDGSLRDVEIIMHPVGDRWVSSFTDVTERKRSEQKISKYSRDLQRLLTVSRDMTATTDVAGLYRAAVQTAVDLLQFDFSTVMVLSDDKAGLTIMDTIGFPRDMIGRFSLVEGQGLSTYVVKNKRPDAVSDFRTETRFEVPAVVHERNIRSALCVPMMLGDEVFGVLIGHTLEQREFQPEDIALYENIGNEAAIAIKNASSLQALAKSERMFQAIIDAEPECVKLLDEHANLITMNRAGLEMIQADALDQVKGRCVCGLVAPQHQEEFMELTRRVFQGESGTMVFDIVGMKGRPLWLETHAVPLHNERNEIVALLGVTRDITERKLAEDALRENEARLDFALHSAHMGVWRWEIPEDRRYFDDLTCQLLGIDAAKFMGSAEEFFHVVHPEDRQRVKDALARTLEQGVTYEPEYRVVWPDGSVRFITARGRLVRDDQGAPLRINGILWDVTEQRLLEEERLKAQKLESIGTLAGGIAHDFNNLLQGVFGYISMAKMTFDQKEKSLEMLEQAEKALHQSVSLTSQLLTFSKGGKPVMMPIDLRPVIENAAKFALSGSRTGHRISTQLGLWHAEADAGQIGQVVQNIVLNADQAMSEGGTVEIVARNLERGDAASVKGLDAGEYVEVSIRDSGVGIPAQYLAKIFDPYFTTKEKGSGLGLATSYSIVKNHGGLITIASEPGKGSLFRIYLPAATGRTEPAPRRIQVPAGRSGRILVMDDENVVRAVADELVRALGHEVEVVADGAAAVEKFREAKASGRPYDIVILDLTVRGGMGGVETMRRLQEIDPGVIALMSSGYSDDAAVAEYRKFGFRAFLKKPYDLTNLREVLGVLLSSADDGWGP